MERTFFQLLDRVIVNGIQFHVRGQRKAAEFSFAGVIAHADDERTGNLVPMGEELPLGLDARKRYVLDTRRHEVY